MKVQAYHIGKRILLKSMQSELKLKPILKDPLVIAMAKDEYAAFFKYGVVVFWNVKKRDKDRFLDAMTPFVKEEFETRFDEEATVLSGKKKEAVLIDAIQLTELTPEKIGLISLTLSRSVSLDHFEKEVQRILDQFDPVIRSLQNDGKTRLSTKQLLKMVGFAMNVRHLSTGSLALLDRPNAAWDDPDLSQLFDALSDEYEIDDRYEILKEKLDIIFKNVEFILGFLDTRKSLILEFTIVLLIVIEILIFGYEIWFL